MSKKKKRNRIKLEIKPSKNSSLVAEFEYLARLCLKIGVGDLVIGEGALTDKNLRRDDWSRWL